MNYENKEKIIEIITEFTNQYLDDEYNELCIKLANKLYETDNSLLDSDTDDNWACAIIYTICQLNFLFYYKFPLYIPPDDLCRHFYAKRTKMTAKARNIRRSLNLKLGDKDFSSQFVLSLHIPESDADLKRIREFEEVRRTLRPKRPTDANELDNSQLIDVIEKIASAEDEDEKEKHMSDFYLIIRTAFFILPRSGFNYLTIREEDNGKKFKIPLFTSVDECSELLNDFDDLKPEPWYFVNANHHMDNENFEGFVIDHFNSNFLVTKDMVRKVYPYADKIDYFDIF